jgi:hypothetical protein
MYASQSTCGSRLRAIGVVLIGFCLFLWSSTFVFGILLVCLGSLGLILPEVASFGSRSTYQRSIHLHTPITCGVNQVEMWTQGQSFRFVSKWENLAVWREHRGWFVLSPHGSTPVFLSIERMRTAGVYEAVLSLAQQHAKRFKE